MTFNPLVINASSVRHLLITKSIFLSYGVPAHALEVKLIDHIVDEYKGRIGRRSYIAEMLSEVATTPVDQCQLYDITDKLIEPHPSDAKQSVQRWIVRNGKAVWKVQAGGQERYL